MATYDPNGSDQFMPTLLTTSLCFVMIAGRAIIRLVIRPRTWHWDDSWMILSVIPLAGRATTIAWSALLGGSNDTESTADRELSLELLLPARIFYAGFLWCVKLSLLAFYSRMFSSLPACQKAVKILRIVVYITFITILFPTLLECRPIQLFWNGDPAGDSCSKGRGNLITVAALNLATDLALIIFPLPILWKMQLNFKKKLQLSFVFSIGFFTIFTTIIRLPLILQDGAQRSRSQWASIEIVCACFVANAAFYYGKIQDFVKARRRNSAFSNATSQEMSSRNTATANNMQPGLRRPTQDDIEFDFPRNEFQGRSWAKDETEAESEHFENVESLASSRTVVDKEDQWNWNYDFEKP